MILRRSLFDGLLSNERAAVSEWVESSHVTRKTVEWRILRNFLKDSKEHELIGEYYLMNVI